MARAATLELSSNEPMSDGHGRCGRGFSAAGHIDRRAWGLNWNLSAETGGWLVSEEVQIQLEVAIVGPAE